MISVVSFLFLSFDKGNTKMIQYKYYGLIVRTREKIYRANIPNSDNNTIFVPLFDTSLCRVKVAIKSILGA